MPHSSAPVPGMLRQAPKRLVVATANEGKLREFRSLLAGLPYELSSLAELGLPSPAETGSSFLENAALKARHAAASSGFAAVADDSGIEVDALGGAPGIHSARYAGADADDGANNAKLMSALRGVPGERRRARYRCALVLIDAADAAPLTAEAAWEGFILDAPRGSGGFGYDPYFWLPELDKTAAELTPEEKNRLSHRGKAMRALREALLARLGAQAQPAVRT
ncbi:MAG TPA: RdgB/HAM1 family non-canonical purine NTP pyrophosphatase [Steroidobacteraceae bacterium]|nr:RdgB/HAM1 family non-canonical purine NTP pyrophosphatase [Steroidobacteraceae bacterium]